MTKKHVVLASKDHPFYETLKKTYPLFFEASGDEIYESKEARGLHEGDAIFFEFSLKSREEKMAWAKKLSVDYPFPILMDGTCLWGDAIYDKVKHCVGMHAAAFFSPNDTIEVFCAKEEFKTDIKEFYQEMNLRVAFTSTPGIGFTVPRTVAMIINEAHFALDDGLASEEAIDTAMKFGVNYPLGPLEWKKEMGAKPIVQLLDELYQVTGDPRYKVSPSLRKESL